eukprot:scaffold8190_cov248-Ochromonas_danica.AAC.5
MLSVSNHTAFNYAGSGANLDWWCAIGLCIVCGKQTVKWHQGELCSLFEVFELHVDEMSLSWDRLCAV